MSCFEAEKIEVSRLISQVSGKAHIVLPALLALIDITHSSKLVCKHRVPCEEPSFFSAVRVQLFSPHNLGASFALLLSGPQNFYAAALYVSTLLSPAHSDVLRSALTNPVQLKESAATALYSSSIECLNGWDALWTAICCGNLQGFYILRGIVCLGELSGCLEGVRLAFKRVSGGYNIGIDTLLKIGAHDFERSYLAAVCLRILGCYEQKLETEMESSSLDLSALAFCPSQDEAHDIAANDLDTTQVEPQGVEYHVCPQCAGFIEPTMKINGGGFRESSHMGDSATCFLSDTQESYEPLSRTKAITGPSKCSCNHSSTHGSILGSRRRKSMAGRASLGEALNRSAGKELRRSKRDFSSPRFFGHSRLQRTVTFETTVHEFDVKEGQQQRLKELCKETAESLVHFHNFFAHPSNPSLDITAKQNASRISSGLSSWKVLWACEALYLLFPRRSDLNQAKYIAMDTQKDLIKALNACMSAPWFALGASPAPPPLPQMILLRVSILSAVAVIHDSLDLGGQTLMPSQSVKEALPYIIAHALTPYDSASSNSQVSMTPTLLATSTMIKQASALMMSAVFSSWVLPHTFHTSLSIALSSLHRRSNTTHYFVSGDQDRGRGEIPDLCSTGFLSAPVVTCSPSSLPTPDLGGVSITKVSELSPVLNPTLFCTEGPISSSVARERRDSIFPLSQSPSENATFEPTFENSLTRHFAAIRRRSDRLSAGRLTGLTELDLMEAPQVRTLCGTPQLGHNPLDITCVTSPECAGGGQTRKRAKVVVKTTKGGKVARGKAKSAPAFRPLAMKSPKNATTVLGLLAKSRANVDGGRLSAWLRGGEGGK